VRRVARLLAGVPMAGFYTEEIRGARGRTGFRAVALDGRSARLATVGDGGGPRVGRYSVHLAEFERLALPELEPRTGVALLVLDEIGKMECLSPAFVEAARRALASEVALLGTIALACGGFIAEARRAPGVEVVALTRASRDRLAEEIAARLRGELGDP
jgi:nucleoside-triphosphatase